MTVKKILSHRIIAGRVRRARTESRILESALHVFAEKGPSAPVIDDFIKAARISRGTFYNYFKSTDELLQAVSALLSDELSSSIEEEICHIEDPELKYCTALRLWMAKAELDRSWCSFIAKVWFEGGITHYFSDRDLGLSIKKGMFHCVSTDIGTDISWGTMRQAMLRLAEDPQRHGYGDVIVRQILIGLGIQSEKLDEFMAYPLDIINIDSCTFSKSHVGA